MISSLNEIFPSTPTINVEVPIPLEDEEDEKNRVISQYLSYLDLSFYRPRNQLIPIVILLLKRGLSFEHLNTFRKIHEGGHGFLVLSGFGIQGSLLEGWQLRDHEKAVKIVSKRMSDESVVLLKGLWRDMTNINKLKNMQYHSSIELHEAFAGFCTTMYSDDMKLSFRKLGEEYVKDWTKEGYHETLRFYKDLMWINCNFGTETVVNSVKIAFNTPIFTRDFVSQITRSNKLPVNLNPKARFKMIRSALEKEGAKIKQELAQSAQNVEESVLRAVDEIKRGELIKSMFFDEEFLWINPINILTLIIERDMKLYSSLDKIILGRTSSMIIEESSPGYWKEAMKGETKRRIYHLVKDVLNFKVREDIDTRLVSPLYNTFLLSALKTQTLEGKIECLKRSLNGCIAKHRGSTVKGWSKFKELKCRECPYYPLVKNSEKIYKIISALYN